MTMTVEELIKELKKHPKKSLVGWQDHDSDSVTGFVNYVDSFDPDESPDPEFCAGVKVVLRS